MNKALGFALLVGGIILVVYGLNAKDSITSDVSQALSGSPSNKALWLLVCGSAASVAGAVMVLRPSTRG